ncbi:Uncharacterised protein [Chromobacterium vaccinii]|nr:Uncharacterised protein [Chromobacterium vaccinii]
MIVFMYQRGALLHKSQVGRVSPFPKPIYAIATVYGRPSMLKRFKMAARTCSSAT